MALSGDDYIENFDVLLSHTSLAMERIQSRFNDIERRLSSLSTTEATSTKDDQSFPPSLAPMNKKHATDYISSSPSLLRTVIKEKELFEERCNPFFDSVIDPLEAEHDSTTNNLRSHLQQKIEDITTFYENFMYTEPEEDLNLILSNFQDNDNDELEHSIRRFYNQKENDFLQQLQSLQTSLSPPSTNVTQHEIDYSPFNLFPSSEQEKTETVVRGFIKPERQITKISPSSAAQTNKDYFSSPAKEKDKQSTTQQNKKFFSSLPKKDKSSLALERNTTQTNNTFPPPSPTTTIVTPSPPPKRIVFFFQKKNDFTFNKFESDDDDPFPSHNYQHHHSYNNAHHISNE